MQKLYSNLKDIDTISICTNIANKNIKFALISFKTHRSAAMARRCLLPERTKFFSTNAVRIDWANPVLQFNNIVSI